MTTKKTPVTVSTTPSRQNQTPVKKVKRSPKLLRTPEQVAARLTTFRTITQLATILRVEKPTADNYVRQLKKVRKLETKQVRQGERGPKAIAYKVA